MKATQKLHQKSSRCCSIRPVALFARIIGRSRRRCCCKRRREAAVAAAVALRYRERGRAGGPKRASAHKKAQLQRSAAGVQTLSIVVDAAATMHASRQQTKRRARARVVTHTLRMIFFAFTPIKIR